MSNGMVNDLFLEIFDKCRNACIPAAKFLQALSELNEEKKITLMPDEKYEQWQEDVSTAVCASIL